MQIPKIRWWHDVLYVDIELQLGENCRDNVSVSVHYISFENMLKLLRNVCSIWWQFYELPSSVTKCCPCFLDSLKLTIDKFVTIILSFTYQMVPKKMKRKKHRSKCLVRKGVRNWPLAIPLCRTLGKLSHRISIIQISRNISIIRNIHCKFSCNLIYAHK